MIEEKKQEEKTNTRALKIVGVVIGVLLILGVAGLLGIRYLLGRANERAIQVIEGIEQPDSVPFIDDFKVPEDIREYTDGVGNEEAEEVSGMPEGVSGRDTTLPTHPGSVGIHYDLANPIIGGYAAVYIVPAPLEEVIRFYEDEFAGREDIEHWEGTHPENPFKMYMVEGIYTFEMMSPDSEAMFVIRLDHYEGQEDKTKVHIQGSALFFEE